MRNSLVPILLLVCIASTAHSQPGSPPTTGATVPPPCLSITQRVRLGDSLAMLPQVRRAAIEYRTSADLAQGRSRTFSNALVAQQGLTTRAHVEAEQWKHKARRRGLLNWIYTALAGSAAYLLIKY